MTSCFPRAGFRFGACRRLRHPGGLLAFIVLCGVVFPRLAQGVEVRPPPFPELVKVADYIVRAKVVAKESTWEGTEPRRQIFTHFTLEVLETLAGEPPEPLVLKALGGEIGEDSMRIEGVTELQVGQEYVLFVRGNGRQFYPLVALMHGMYPVIRDEAADVAVVARANGAPLRNTAEVAAPLTHPEAGGEDPAAALPPMTLEQFQTRIRAVTRETAP